MDICCVYAPRNTDSIFSVSPASASPAPLGECDQGLSNQRALPGFLCCCLVLSCLSLLATPQTVAHQAPLSTGLSKNTGVGCHFLLQGIFPTQGSNLHLFYWRFWRKGSSTLWKQHVSRCYRKEERAWGKCFRETTYSISTWRWTSKNLKKILLGTQDSTTE